MKISLTSNLDCTKQFVDSEGVEYPLPGQDFTSVDGGIAESQLCAREWVGPCVVDLLPCESPPSLSCLPDHPDYDPYRPISEGGGEPNFPSSSPPPSSPPSSPPYSPPYSPPSSSPPPSSSEPPPSADCIIDITYITMLTDDAGRFTVENNGLGDVTVDVITASQQNEVLAPALPQVIAGGNSVTFTLTTYGNDLRGLPFGVETEECGNFIEVFPNE